MGRNAFQFHFLGRSQFKALLVTFLVIVTDSPVSVQQLRTSSAETAHPSCDIDGHSSSSHMHVVNHNWSATKQRLHPQSVAEISRHSVLSVDRIRQRETSSGSRHKDTGQCKSPFPSIGTKVSLFRAKTVQ